VATRARAAVTASDAAVHHWAYAVITAATAISDAPTTSAATREAGAASQRVTDFDDAHGRIFNRE
jgi:hypothetical protein